MGLPGVTYVPSPLHGLALSLIENICRGDFQLKRVNVTAPGLPVNEIAAINGTANGVTSG
jgi:hypothetical protein